MQRVEDVATLQQVLPGRWSVKATNYPVWYSGERRDPTFEYVVTRPEPFVLGYVATFVEEDGKTKTIRAVDRWNGQGFTRTPTGVLGGLSKSRWEVAGVRQGLMVLRFETSAATTAGIDVFVGEGVDATELRSVIAADPASFGLRFEEFASLTWLDHLPAH